MLTGLSYLGEGAGDLADAKDAGRSERRPGEPACEVSDGLEAGRIGLLLGLETDFCGDVFRNGTFLRESRDGLVSLLSTSTQLALDSAIPLSR